MAQIIPGVQVSVVKEVVSPAANPSGIVGLLGITDRGPASGARVGSWNQFLDVFGRSSAYSLPEAKQIIENGAFEMVVIPVVDGADRAEVTMQDSTDADIFVLRARSAGARMNGSLSAEVTNLRNAATPATAIFDLIIRYRDIEEVFRNVQVADPDGTGYLLPIVNANSTLAVILPLASDLGLTPSDGTEFTFAADKEQKFFTEATVTDPDAFKGIVLTWQSAAAGKVKVEQATGQTTFDLVVYSGTQIVERFDNLEIDADPQPDGELAIVAALAGSNYVRANLWKAHLANAPKVATYTFSGGDEPNSAAYGNALQLLTREGDVDLVVASVFSEDPSAVYAAVAAHCSLMSTEAKNRLGFGGAPIGASVQDVVDMATLFNSERFVLVAPAEIVGSVAGRIAQLDYFRSPTFKTLNGVTKLQDDYLPTDLRSLLKANVLPVDLDRQLGFIVVKGITTSGEQISVTRVQDHAVRAVKRIADLFIGKLNNQIARLALRQKLSEYFQQMEKDGAIVPSTDGTDPAFKVDVYSSQADFAAGIVRVDIAVRPVRAIDYVTATILVQA